MFTVRSCRREPRQDEETKDSSPGGKPRSQKEEKEDQQGPPCWRGGQSNKDHRHNAGRLPRAGVRGSTQQGPPRSPRDNEPAWRGGFHAGQADFISFRFLLPTHRVRQCVCCTEKARDTAKANSKCPYRTPFSARRDELEPPARQGTQDEGDCNKQNPLPTTQMCRHRS